MLKQHKQEANNVYDYAVDIEGLPKKGIDENSLRDFFGQYGTIHEVVIGIMQKDLLTHCKRLAELKILIASEKLKIKKGIKSSKCKEILNCSYKKSYLKSLEAEYEKTKEKVSKNQNQAIKKNDFVKVFIIFETIEAKQNCLNAYKRPFSFRYSQPKNLRWDEKFVLIVQEAKNPNLILWENLEVSFWKQKLLSSIASFISFIVIGISLLLV